MHDLGSFDAVILGGGPAGLAAAWELSRLGARCLVVEREEATGGLCRTHEREGFRFDMGGHRFITADRDLLDRVVALCGDDLLLAERSSEVALLGQRFRYPLELPDLVRNLPPGVAARAVASYVAARLRPGRSPPDSFERWAVQRFGRVLYDLFIGPYTAKVWGVPPADLSPEWATQRISFGDLRHVAAELFARTIGRRAPDGAPRTCARTFLYPRLGMGQLFDRVRDAAAEQGARVLTSTRVVAFERARDRLTAVLVEGPEGLARARADHVLSTIPLPALLRLVLGPTGHELSAPFVFRPVRFLDVALDREVALPTTWCYVGEAGLRAGRLQEPRRRSPYMSPPGTTSLMVEVPHAAGDDIDRMSDDALLRHVRAEVAALGVDLTRDVRFAFSVRAPEAYPVHRRGIERARARAFDALARVTNLRTFGRQGAFRFIFADAALRMGLLAAEGLAAGRAPSSAELASVASAPKLIEVESLVEVRRAARPT